MEKQLSRLLKNACKRYMHATVAKFSEAKRMKIYFEIQGIKSIIEQQ